MISQYLKLLFPVCVAILILSGCVLSELGEPPPWETDLWLRSGHTRSQTYSAVLKCRQESTERTNRENIEVEQLCMLRAGYRFVNWRAPHTFCKPGEKDPWAWNTPACRSLRGELVITPDESAPLPPPVMKDSPPNSYIPAIPVAPSALPEQRLQEKIQKYSNNQMNQLLLGGGRK